jgi:hypothetical protein
MYNFSLQIDDSAISHFLVSRFLQILTKPALRFKFLSFLLMHGIFTLGREVFSARLTPYLWYKLRFCLDVSAADASTQRSLLLLLIMTLEIIVIDKNNLLSNAQHYSVGSVLK